jgi:murein DD-endopeptidase MepM/ murein hydrolase activator NlpD
VQQGETLSAIARHYGVSVDELARVNDLDDPSRLAVGQRLWIPGRGGKPRPRVTGGDGGISCPIDEGQRRAARRRARSEADLSFVWPVRGGISSCFGSRNGHPHDGIDVMVPLGTPVKAAEAGKVVFSGTLGGYGDMIVVKHAGAWSSVYAHLGEIGVRLGRFVEQGEQIGESGQSGRATGPHLHFEIRRSQRPEEPLLYLP